MYGVSVLVWWCRADQVHRSAMNMLLYGQKRWLLQPPPSAVYSSVHPIQLFASVDEHRKQLKKDTKRGGSLRRAKQRQQSANNKKNESSKEEGGVESSGTSSSDPNLNGLECVQESGDIVFVPAGWAHATLK